MKVTVLFMCTLIGIISFTIAVPYGSRSEMSYPHEAMAISGFYRRPHYAPDRSMTAFASRDSVATNTYSGNEYLSVPVEESANDSKNTEHNITDSEQTGDDEGLEYSTTSKKTPTKRKHVTKNREDDSAEEEAGSWPFQMGRNGFPSYNAFFPIMFGGRESSRRSGDSNDGYVPGSATAIANSFSTGKGGVASSHATAYGDPYLSMLLRSSGNFKRTNSKIEN